MGGRFLDEIFKLNSAPLSNSWTRPRNLLAYYAPLVGVFIAAVGFVVIVAWAANLPWLTTLGSGFASMKPVTALCFVLAGSALALNSKFLPPFEYRRTQLILAALLLAFSGGEHLHNAAGIDLGTADMLYVAPELRSANGHMSAMTALLFLVASSALALIVTYRRRPTTVAGGLAAAMMLVSTFALAGYGLQSQALYRIQPFQTMALHTAFLFLILSLGIIGIVVAANWRSYGYVDSRIARFGMIMWLVAVMIELFSAQFVLRISSDNDVALFALLVFKFIIMVVLFAAVVSAGVVLMSLSSQEQENLKARLVENEKLFRTTFQNALQGIQVIRADGTRVDVNQRACEIFGRSREDLMKNSMWTSTKPADIEEGKLKLAQLASGEISSYEREKRIIRGDGEERWIKVIANVGAVANDDEKTFIVVVDDIQSAKDAEQARDLLMGEINHRVKNTLAVIQGMIGKLKLSNVTAEDMANSLMVRITNLGASYDLLNRKDWSEPTLLETYEEAMRIGFDVYRDRISCALTNIKVDSQAAIYLGMIFHELATNSVKYGALSSNAGKVEIFNTTEPREDGKVWATVTWTESGGPPVSPPKSEGFGTFVLQKGVSFGLRGTCDIAYKKEGLTVTWSFPTAVTE